MNKYEVLDQELYDLNIKLYERELKACDGFCVCYNNNRYICVNEECNNFKKYWIAEHELEHLKTNSLYTIYNKKTTIRRCEMKANDALIEKLDLANKTLICLKKGMDKRETCQELELPPELFDHIYKYIIRKGMLKL